MKPVYLFILMVLPVCCLAQSTVTDELIVSQIERMVENTDDEVDYTELLEEYWSICENKVNINDAEELNQLIELHLVSVFVVENIQAYRKDFGDIMIMDELKYVDGIDELTLSILQPLICFEKSGKKKNTPKAKNIIKKGKHQLWLQTERNFNEKAGYQSKTYLGDPNKLLVRYNFSYGKKTEAGFALEKDAGEYLFKPVANDSVLRLIDDNAYPIMDFVSFHFLIRDLNFVKTLALGDYQLAFGQGVTMGSGTAFTAAGGSLLRKSKKIRASKSANEGKYLRGVATTLNYHDFELTVFYSNKKADANLGTSGLHRTVSELLNRHAVTQQLLGGNLSYRAAKFQIGYTIHKTWLSPGLYPDPRLYNLFYFRGETLVNQGVDFYYILKKAAIYGEAAVSDNGAPAATIGTTLQPAGFIDITVLYRYYDKKYHNFYSNAFAAGSNPRNEKGLYLSASIAFAPRWQLIATADFPQSDWIKSTAYAPSRTQDYNMQITHNINKNALFFIQLRYKDKEKNGPADNVYMRQLVHDRKWTLRFHITYPVGDNFTLKNRVEYVVNKDVPKNGRCYLIYQDVMYNPADQPFSIAFRYAMFNSPTGMIYAYENDVLNAFAIAALSHKGTRIYLVGKAKLMKKLSVNAKIGWTIYSDITEIGSGLEKIKGNVKTDGKLQLIWKI